MKTEQEKADWKNPWPEDGEQCPECGHGLIEVQEFGQGSGLEVQTWCVGLNGTKLEDADERDEDEAGCGWCGTYYPNDHGQATPTGAAGRNTEDDGNDE